jgi:23S rRNA (pseudouridine1915-N3)-methyltransferase
MKLILLFRGKTDEAYLREGIDNYAKRIKNYIPLEISITGERGKKPGTFGTAKARGSERHLSTIGKTSFVVLMDEKGERYSSEGFAKFIEKISIRGYKEMVFVTGDAYGFPDEYYNRADHLVSLSDMTFTHQMVRLILAEQLYRAMTIIRGEPYHHG